MGKYLQQIIPVIDAAIKRRKTSAVKASTEAVGNFTLIRNMKTGKIPSIENMKKLCDVLGLDMYIGPPEDYHGLRKACILGKITGENIISDYDLTALGKLEDIKNCEQISAPANAGSMIAFTIEDNGLFPPLSKGATVFADFSDKCDSSLWEQFVGDLCLLWLKDGNGLIRVLRKGDSAGTFNLESLAGKPTLPDQLPTLCLPVRWIRKANS